MKKPPPFIPQVDEQNKPVRPEVQQSLSKLTQNYQTLPKAQDLVDEIDRSLAPPTPDCLPSDTGLEREVEQSPETDLHDPCSIPGVAQNFVKNCRQALGDPSIPRNALKYALKTMKLNATSFRSHKCYRFGGKGEKGKAGYQRHFSSFKGESRESWLSKMRGGLPNKCSFIINDTDDLIQTWHKEGTFYCRGKSHYINLCGSQLVHKEDYFNLGTGTCKRKAGFANKPGVGTTLIGAFFTGTNVFNFTANNTSLDADYYAPMRRRNPEGKTHGLALYGVNANNNRSAADRKHIHISPFPSSLGCPSVNEKKWKMIKELGNKGPSLVLNYREGAMEDLEDCSE